MNSLLIQCPIHRKNIYAMNIHKEVSLGDRIVCADCELRDKNIFPLEIYKGIQEYKKIIDQKNQTINEKQTEFIHNLSDFKRILNKLTIQLRDQMELLSKEIQLLIDGLIAQFQQMRIPPIDNNTLTLTSLQIIASELSAYFNNQQQITVPTAIEEIRKGMFKNQQNIYFKAKNLAQTFLEEIRQIYQYSVVQQVAQDDCIGATFSNKENLFISSSKGKLRCYLLENERLVFQKEQQTQKQYFNCISFGPTDDWFAACGSNKTITRWNLEPNYNFTMNCELENHLDVITQLVINKEGDQMLSSSFDKTIKVWKYENSIWSISQALSEHLKQISSISLSQTGNLLVSGSFDQFLIVWQKQNDKRWQYKQKIQNAHQTPVYSVCFISEKKFVSGSQDLKIWSQRINSEIFDQVYMLTFDYEVIDRIVFYPQFSIILIQNYKNTIIGTINNDQIQIFQKFDGLYQGSNLTQDGKYLVQYDWDNKQLILRKLKLQQMIQ